MQTTPASASTPSSPTLGILLFAHGSRDAQWRLPIEAVAEQLRLRQPDVAVSCAYLELCTPDLPEAASTLIAMGVRQLRIFPLFLGVGKHAREDLPLLVTQIRTSHPEVTVELLPTAGENPALIALMADIALSRSGALQG